MKLSVIIPAFNEKNTISEVVETVAALDLPKQIIVVDDGSDDGTTEILERLRSTVRGLNVQFLKRNSGKGAAIHQGLTQVRGDIVIIQDADLELDPGEYPRLIEPIVKGEADVVYGSRFLTPVDGLSRFSLVGNKVITWLTNRLYGLRLTDQATGYKVFRANVIKRVPLECRGFEFCSEVTAKIARMGHEITEVPVSYIPRPKEEGKKVSWRDGVTAVRTLLRYRRFSAPDGDGMRRREVSSEPRMRGERAGGRGL
ncbi:MAG: glycosyltransferase family 2 protein [Terriglobia bacterium]